VTSSRRIFFVGDRVKLILGDFGIVFLPNQPERLSVTGESVGPHDFMPPWVYLDEQPGPINPNFDVYMLGKVLWCMVAGKLKLHREDFRAWIIHDFASEKRKGALKD
jgi:hypothetical protein